MTGRSKEENSRSIPAGKSQNVRYPDDYAPEVLETFEQTSGK